jgi:hypothetical protein
MGRSVWREDRSVIYYYSWPSPAQLFLDTSPLGLVTHILLPHVRHFPIRRLLRLAGLRWRYSTPPPHGKCWCQSPSVLYSLGADPIENTAIAQQWTSTVVAYCSRLYLGTGCLPRIGLRGNVFIELLPSNGSTCHNIKKQIVISVNWANFSHCIYSLMYRWQSFYRCHKSLGFFFFILKITTTNGNMMSLP